MVHPDSSKYWCLSTGNSPVSILSNLISSLSHWIDVYHFPYQKDSSFFILLKRDCGGFFTIINIELSPNFNKSAISSYLHNHLKVIIIMGLPQPRSLISCYSKLLHHCHHALSFMLNPNPNIVSL